MIRLIFSMENPWKSANYLGNRVFFWGGEVLKQLQLHQFKHQPLSFQAAFPQCSSKRDRRALHLAPKQCHPSSRHLGAGSSASKILSYDEFYRLYIYIYTHNSVYVCNYIWYIYIYMHYIYKHVHTYTYIFWIQNSILAMNHVSIVDCMIWYVFTRKLG